MAVPTTKAELLAAIETTYAKLIKELQTIPAPLTAAPTLEGHSKGEQMSVRDLVAYLIGWNELVLKWHERSAAGELLELPEAGYGWNELGRLARKFYEDYASLSYAELLERLALAKLRIVRLIEDHSDHDLYGAPWYRSYTMGRMIQFNTSSPYANAQGRLRKWVKAQEAANR